jgi:MFS family permease
VFFPLMNRWGVLALVFFIGIAVPMQFQAVPALTPFLVSETDLTYSETGVLTGLFMAPGVLLALPSGVLANRIGSRNVVALGLAIMLAGSLLFVTSVSMIVMPVARVLGGIGAAVLLTQSSKVITDWFADKEINTAMGIFASSFGLGIGVATAVLPVIAAFSSWQAAGLANAGLTAIALILVILLLRDSHEGDTLQAGSLWNIKTTEVVLTLHAGAARGLFVTGYVVFMSFAPVLLVEHGTALEQAAVLVSFVAVVSAVSVPLGGFLSDATGKPDLFIVGGAVGAGMACFALPAAGPAILWILLFGLFRGGCTGGIMALPAKVLRAGSRNTGFAIASTVYFASMAVVPPLAGYILDLTDNSAAPLWFAGVLWLMIIAVLTAFRLLQRRWA